VLVEKELEVERWFVPEPFNPASPQQVISYMQHAGHYVPPNKFSKTQQPSTDEQTLARLARKDEFYSHILAFRRLSKLSSTYVNGLLGLVDANGRIHPKFLHNPSTWRLSCQEPNWQNIPDAEEPDSIEKRFRRCVIPAPGCVLVEADFSAIEAVQTGWYCNDPDYVRLARMGIHSYLVSHKVGEPADIAWEDEHLHSHLAYIKKKYKDGEIYYAFKRTVHLTNYGGSPHMMMKVDPKIFTSIAVATTFQNFYLNLMPKLSAWHRTIRQRAAAQNFLGGDDHPYHFRHWFWDVMKMDATGGASPGSDWNRVVAFYPQSTAAGNLYDCLLTLQDHSSPYFVGDMYHGATPLRAFIHDSILAEVPKSRVDEYCDKLHGAMTQPIKVQPLPWNPTQYLTIDADIKVGSNWGAMEAIV
jgi:hypothetical protein